MGVNYIGLFMEGTTRDPVRRVGLLRIRVRCTRLGSGSLSWGNIPFWAKDVGPYTLRSLRL